MPEIGLEMLTDPDSILVELQSYLRELLSNRPSEGLGAIIVLVRSNPENSHALQCCTMADLPRSLSNCPSIVHLLQSEARRISKQHLELVPCPNCSQKHQGSA